MANWNRFMEDIELALYSEPDILDVHKGNKVITDLILLADKHHVPKGRIKNLLEPLPQHIKTKIKERNNICIDNHSDSGIPQLSKKITDSTGQHKTDQWKQYFDQIVDHKENSHTLWNTIKRKNGRNSPSKKLMANQQ